MKMRKLAAMLLAAACITCLFPAAAYAADSTGSITFAGEAAKFVNPGTGYTSFEDMMPGETRTQAITLTNSDSKNVNFYLSGKITSNIAAKGDSADGQKNVAVYDLSLAKDGTEFYSGMIGNGEQVGESYLGDNYLLATLKPGESTTVTMTVALDGDSTRNPYETKTGLINLEISCGYPDEPPVVTKTNTVVKTVTRYVQGAATTVTRTVATAVKTGDYSLIAPYIAILAAALGVIIGIIVFSFRRKKKGGKA